jgi:SagB-type dehydrogenase family enzyme
MIRRYLISCIGCAAITLSILVVASGQPADDRPGLQLPEPGKTGGMSLVEAIRQRRSIRRYADRILSKDQIGQLCWAAQGITLPGSENTVAPGKAFRAAPSAGALYPLELYVATAGGVWHYRPVGHRLERFSQADIRPALQKAAYGQKWIAQAPAVFVFAADVSRTAKKYGSRAKEFVLIEVGHAAQNLLLQATAMGLGAVPVGGFKPGETNQALAPPAPQRVMYLVPVGFPAGE